MGQGRGAIRPFGTARAAFRCRLAADAAISPPMPFTEWPYGGTVNIGTTGRIRLTAR